MIVIKTIIRMAGRICFNIGKSSRKTDGGNCHVDELDADERHDDAAEAVDQQVTAQDVAAPSGR